MVTKLGTNANVPVSARFCTRWRPLDPSSVAGWPDPMSTSRPKSHVLTMLRQGGIVPVIRAESSAIALKVAEALVAGGITTLEITMTVPDALDGDSRGQRAVRRRRAARRGNGHEPGAR